MAPWYFFSRQLALFRPSRHNKYASLDYFLSKNSSWNDFLMRQFEQRVTLPQNSTWHMRQPCRSNLSNLSNLENSEEAKLADEETLQQSGINNSFNDDHLWYHFETFTWCCEGSQVLWGKLWASPNKTGAKKSGEEMLHRTMFCVLSCLKGSEHNRK